MSAPEIVTPGMRQTGLEALDDVIFLKNERDDYALRVIKLELALSCALPVLEAGAVPGTEAARVVSLIRMAFPDGRLPRPPKSAPVLVVNPPSQP
jgi:hypothetical protein